MQQKTLSMYLTKIVYRQNLITAKISTHQIRPGLLKPLKLVPVKISRYSGRIPPSYNHADTKNMSLIICKFLSGELYKINTKTAIILELISHDHVHTRVHARVCTIWGDIKILCIPSQAHVYKHTLTGTVCACISVCQAPSHIYAPSSL